MLLRPTGERRSGSEADDLGSISPDVLGSDLDDPLVVDNDTLDAVDKFEAEEL